MVMLVLERAVTLSPMFKVMGLWSWASIVFGLEGLLMFGLEGPVKKNGSFVAEQIKVIDNTY